MDIPDVAAHGVNVDGQTLETWLDGHAKEAPGAPEATSSEILAQNHIDMDASRESKPQRVAAAKMGKGRQTSQSAKPSNRPKPETDS